MTSKKSKIKGFKQLIKDFYLFIKNIFIFFEVKKKTDSKNLIATKTNLGKLMTLSQCVDCDSKKLRLINNKKNPKKLVGF